MHGRVRGSWTSMHATKILFRKEVPKKEKEGKEVASSGHKKELSGHKRNLFRSWPARNLKMILLGPGILRPWSLLRNVSKIGATGGF